MDSTDDDFGELYVNENMVQASDAFVGDVGFVKSCEESECATNSGEDMGFEGTVKPGLEGEMKKFDVMVKDPSPCVDVCAVNLTEANEEESEYSDSDSDDDLKIVLKDDYSTALPVTRGLNTNTGGYCVADAVEASKTYSFQRRKTRNWVSVFFFFFALL